MVNKLIDQKIEDLKKIAKEEANNLAKTLAPQNDGLSFGPVGFERQKTTVSPKKRVTFDAPVINMNLSKSVEMEN